jgi:hypothetical protein
VHRKSGFAAAVLAEFIKESTCSRVHASLVTLCSVGAAAAWFHELTRPTGMPNELNGSACRVLPYAKPVMIYVFI